MKRALLTAAVFLGGCASAPEANKEESKGPQPFHLRGQAIPLYALTADPAQFEPTPGVVVLHYYGAGGWGIQWGAHYLLTAPYFTNHDLASLAASRATNWSPISLPQIVPDTAAVLTGFAGTPVARTEAVLIGHGHVDHAGDVPAFFEPGLIAGKPALIADRSTVNELAAISWRFGCIAPIDDGEPEEVAKCPLEGVRITALHHAHAPHLNLAGVEVAAFGRIVKTPATAVPSRADDYKLGNTWAYLIDLLDAKGKVAFRIHYVDAAAGPPHGLVPKALLAERDVDVHIACVPGFEQSDAYPGRLLERARVRYVLAGHWEDFFQTHGHPLKPLRNVLDERALERFVDAVERELPHARGVAPFNKNEKDCAPPRQCGPRGEAWALPVPGETYRFLAQSLAP